MYKRIISICLVFVFLIGFAPAAAAAGDLGNFKEVNTYAEGQFSDVSSDAWYAGSVESAFAMGLMKGSSGSQFNPAGNVTVAEAITMAARIHRIYTTGIESFTQTSPWYQIYVDYAANNGIISYGQFSSYTAAATRLQFATIFASALPDGALSNISTVEDSAIPDTDSAAVYKLYRAGILTGDDSGAFNPESTITRAEASAIVSRMADESLRKDITLKVDNSKPELTAEQIFAQCSPAVFFIEVYDENGEAYASGSGFIISKAGKAVTNYHVIEGASSAKITTSDTGEVFDVLGVYDYSISEDWAVLKIDGSGFSFLDIGEASTAVGGATVWAIGNPLGLQNTISQGLISNPARDLDGVTYIQTSAAISHGSSGGALINKYGEVIGITSASFVDGQNLNLALPIEVISSYSDDSYAPLSALDEAAEAEKKSLKLSASETSVTLEVGDSADIVFTHNASGHFPYNIVYNIGNQNVVSYSSGEWSDDGKSLSLTFCALSEGTTYISVSVVDGETGEVLASTKVVVNVDAGEAYYEGFYPVPDYGYFTGTSLYDVYTANSSEFALYYYAIDDLDLGAYDTIYGYIDLLEKEGFYYSRDFTNGSDFTMAVYANDDYGMEVYFGPIVYNDVLCLCVIAWY
ncbi:MAG: trypsin-like peptidase domain-containing protein [Oscillospiraceae bacterium]